MPIFEYLCRPCDRQFEILVRGSDTIACPECGRTDVDKLLSAPAAVSGRQKQLPITSACPPADCSALRTRLLPAPVTRTRRVLMDQFQNPENAGVPGSGAQRRP